MTWSFPSCVSWSTLNRLLHGSVLLVIRFMPRWPIEWSAHSQSVLRETAEGDILKALAMSSLLQPSCEAMYRKHIKTGSGISVMVTDTSLPFLSSRVLPLSRSTRFLWKRVIQSSALSIFRSVVRGATFLVDWASPFYHKVADVQVHIRETFVISAYVQVTAWVDGRQCVFG